MCVRESVCSTGALTDGHEAEVVGPPDAQLASHFLHPRAKIEVKGASRPVWLEWPCSCRPTRGLLCAFESVSTHRVSRTALARHSMHVHVETD